MTSPANFTLYLSREGNSIEIKSYEKNGATLPEQEQALACKTHKQVLDFLETLRYSETRNHLNFYHDNNASYDGHGGPKPKGVAHSCDLEKQIEFVKYKISEATHGVKRALKVTCVIQ